MPVIIPRDIPAYQTLYQQNIFVIDETRAMTQDIRALEVLIINLMPLKIQTENQIIALLSNSPLQVNITLLAMKSYEGKHTSKTHLDRFYVDFDSIKRRKFDGAIITGAPIEHLDFDEVIYWEELKNIFDYLSNSVSSSFYICWGAMAALHYFYQIPKIVLEKKIFGVFEHQVISNDILLSNLDDVVWIPQSRYFSINKEIVEKNKDLEILLISADSGIGILSNQKDLFVTGHLEYHKETLQKEYERDIKMGLNIQKPLNYYKNNQIICNWRASASIIFSNWLNYYVYQNTPFYLNEF